jgi:catechol 2,3-dioxygenase-like lactoylglutathione lyase family enzyme
MGILQAAKPVAIICTRDRARAAAFYRDTLGLRMKLEDDYAVVFDVGGIDLRVSTVPDFTPHEHTVLGFSVSDVTAAVKAPREKGVTCNIYKGFNQDDPGIFSLPDSPLRVAWFNDPDGNVLSVTNA